MLTILHKYVIILRLVGKAEALHIEYIGAKMSNTFLYSDPHFGHVGVTRFTRSDGTPLRPWDNPDEMDQALIDNWNKVVNDKDRIYILGDIVINRRCLSTLYALKGRKVLIKGNHDIFKLDDYIPHFDDIRAYQQLDTFYMCHIPMHPQQLPHWCTGNIHGHLHSNLVLDQHGKPDNRYINVCVEHTDYTPIEFEEIRKGWRPWLK